MDLLSKENRWSIEAVRRAPENWIEYIAAIEDPRRTQKILAPVDRPNRRLSSIDEFLDCL